METLPELRTDIDLIPARVEGRAVIVVRDSLGIADPNAAIAAEIGRYLPLFNGSSTVEDLQLGLMRDRGGTLVFRSEVEKIVGELSRVGILQTEGYREAKQRIVREFAETPVRPAAFAGHTYPVDPAELCGYLDRVLSLPDPPGCFRPDNPSALAAPHIDLRVAERTYATGYRALRGAEPGAILLLGTGHALGGSRYCVSSKSFETPLGRVPTDREAVDRLVAAAPEAVAREDFPHRGEHSLEFQLLFLQRLFPMEGIQILPVLCGQMEDLFGRVRSPLDVPAIRAFVEELVSWLADPPRGKLVVAGVDLSHVGPKFGDSQPAGALEPAVRAHDRELLDALVEGDPERVFAVEANFGNRYRVCGFSTLWTLLAVLPGSQGVVLDYDVWHEAPTRSAVSFCSVAFQRAPGSSVPSVHP